jgi:hypothetical protein
MHNEQLFVLFTPTYLGDLHYFARLRRSILRVGVDAPHLAVVSDDELDRFEELFGGEPGLRLISTAQALPPLIEARRKFKLRRQDPRYWLTKRRRLPGWYAQQFIKLNAPSVVSREFSAILFVDSDCFFTRRVQYSDLVVQPEGKLARFEGFDDDAERSSWIVASARFLDLDPVTLRLRQHISAPVLTPRESLVELQGYVESIHAKPWYLAMLRANVFEYNTLGLYLAHVESPPRTEGVEQRLCAGLWTSGSPAETMTWLQERALDATRKMIHLQRGHVPLPANLDPWLEGLWDRAGRDCA